MNTMNTKKQSTEQVTSCSSDSSNVSEKLTIAYTESAVESDSPEQSEYSSSLQSSSLETPTSQVSVTSLFAALDHARELEQHYGYDTMSFSEGPKTRALDYLRVNCVYQLFSFMMSHLLARTPEDPVPFLESLVDRCLRYRDQDEEPPLLFLEPHIRSVYTALDPLDDGSITYRQYLVGMSTLGVTEFNIIPDGMDHDNRDIPRRVFLAEAKVALLRQLDRILGMRQPTNQTDSKRSKSDECKPSISTKTISLDYESLLTNSNEQIQVVQNENLEQKREIDNSQSKTN